ncbi:hypothetical protein AMELA_G00270440, partial [Ameiurus melas]
MNQSEKAWLSIRCLLKYKCFAFCVCLIFLPGLHCGKLLCYYCPMQLVNKPCKQVLTECLPGQLCFIANGHYGAYSGGLIKGCILEDKCLMKVHPGAISSPRTVMAARQLTHITRKVKKVHSKK